LAAFVLQVFCYDLKYVCNKKEKELENK